MNSFGTLFRTQIFGASHGTAVGILIDGCPAGIELSEADFHADIERRKGGLQKGTTPRKEDDIPVFVAGIFKGRATGEPIMITFANNNTRSADYEKQRDVPRPGHADFVASRKFGGYEDYRGGGHFSGRLTVCLVAAGVIAKKILKLSGNNIQVEAKIEEIGGEQDIEKGLQKAIDAKDTIGGIVSCTVNDLPIGLGEPFYESVESLISHAVFSIPAVKGISFGAGFKAARMFGSEHNDSLEDLSGKTGSNNAGGIVGGLTNGNPLYLQVVIKPTSSTPKEQFTLNTTTNEKTAFSVKGRHDLCIALRVPVVLEAVVASVLADLMIRAGHIPRIIPR